MADAPRTFRPWRTLSGRMALGAAAGVVAAALVFLLVGVTLQRSQSTREERARLDRQVTRLAGRFGGQLQEAGRSGSGVCTIDTPTLEALAGAGTLIGYTGLELGDLCGRRAGRIPPSITAQVSIPILARDGIQRIAVERSLGNGTLIASAAPVVVGSQILGALIVARPKAEVATRWPEVARRVALASLAGLFVALVLVIVISRRVTRPLRQLAAASSRVAEGSRSVMIGRAGTVEVDRLGAAFNAMVTQLAKRDRLARDFLMRITHDLRTPLTAIRGHAAAIADGIVPQDAVPRSLAAIETEATRLERLVSDLLDLAKLDVDQVRIDVDDCDLAEILHHACDLVEPRATEQRIAIDRDLPATAPMRTDAVRVGQIVANLLNNGLRWTPKGGAVTVRVAMLSTERLSVEVLDTGPGVAESEWDTIFAPFTSSVTPDGRYGTGLGLATARQLARALGGDLTVRRAPGGGGAFQLTLPRDGPSSRPTE